MKPANTISSSNSPLILLCNAHRCLFPCR